jgi:hypothetical protein
VHKLDREVSRNRALAIRRRAPLAAHSYVLVRAAWYFTGVLVALAAVATWWLLRPQ